MILVTGDSHHTVGNKLAKIKKIFLVGEGHATVQEVISIVGDTRPGNESAHEQFVSRLSSQNLSIADNVPQLRLP